MAVVTQVPKTLAQLHRKTSATTENALSWVMANNSWLCRVISKHRQWLREAQVDNYQLAYDGFLSSIDERERDRGDGTNNKLQVNYAQVIIDTVVDYMLGKPVVWAFEKGSDDVPDGFLDTYRELLIPILSGEHSQRVLAELLRQGSIAYYSTCLLWIDEDGNIDYETFPTQEIIPIFDSRGRLQMLIRHYEVEDESQDFLSTKNKVEVYDSKYVVYFTSDASGSAYELDMSEVGTGNPIEHMAGRIPACIYTNGSPASYAKRLQMVGTSDLGNGVLTLLENYASVMSDKANTVDRLLDQYLLLTGVDVDQAEILKMREARAVALSSKDSSAEFIAPSQNDNAVENHLNRLRETIHEMTFTPKLGDLTGATATEILMKYSNLAIKAGKKELYLTPAIRQMVDVLTDMLNAKRLADAGVESIHEILSGQAPPPASIILYKSSWVSWTINRNLPQNFVEIVTIVSQLIGFVPDSYLYELLWFIEDPQAALDEMKKQKEEAAQLNLGAIGFSNEFANTSDSE